MNNEWRSQQELIIECIICNLQHYQKLVSPYKTQRQLLLDNEPSLLHNDINKQYDKILRSVVLSDLMSRLQGLNILDAMVVLEDVDVSQL